MKQTFKDYLIDNYSPLDEKELEDTFEAYLNEIYGIVNICGSDYYAGTVFREIDPTGFDVDVSNWVSEEYTYAFSEYWDTKEYNKATEDYEELEEGED